MKINRISIDGIANISKVSLELADITALVAPNGYGKSNVLTAIDFAVQFITADGPSRRRMMNGTMRPNFETSRDFKFEISGEMAISTESIQFQYGYTFSWPSEGTEGVIDAEWLKIKQKSEQRYRQIIKRNAKDGCLVLPSPAGRCNKKLVTERTELAVAAITRGGDSYIKEYALQLCRMRIPRLETLDNPASYFATDNEKGIDILDGMTLSRYLFHLDLASMEMLTDGLRQLFPNIEEFKPEEIVLADGHSTIYDVTVKELNCSRPTSIRRLSSGTKRMIFLFTLCIAAEIRDIPLIMLEELENSVHPRLMENLLLALRSYSLDTKILLTSHSPYLMRFLRPAQIYFGQPNNRGVAEFRRVREARIAAISRQAAEEELTFGEYMFDMMIGMQAEATALGTIFGK